LALFLSFSGARRQALALNGTKWHEMAQNGTECQCRELAKSLETWSLMPFAAGFLSQRRPSAKFGWPAVDFPPAEPGRVSGWSWRLD
jgi:hypothetical protein